MNFKVLLFVGGLVMFISAVDVIASMPPEATSVQWTGILSIAGAGLLAMFLSNTHKD